MWWNFGLLGHNVEQFYLAPRKTVALACSDVLQPDVSRSSTGYPYQGWPAAQAPIPPTEWSQHKLTAMANDTTDTPWLSEGCISPPVPWSSFPVIITKTKYKEAIIVSHWPTKYSRSCRIVEMISSVSKIVSRYIKRPSTFRHMPSFTSHREKEALASKRKGRQPEMEFLL